LLQQNLKSIKIAPDVNAFQAIDTQNMIVLGNDGRLWREQAPFGVVPPTRQLVDTNVKQFYQGANPPDIFVLGMCGNLWLEHGVASIRVLVDTNVRSFRALGDFSFVWALGTDGNLWLDFAPFGVIPPPNRVLIDSNVLAFQPLDRSDVMVLRHDGTLWLEHGDTGTPTRASISTDVMEFVASDTQNVLVLTSDGELWWKESRRGSIPPVETLIDRTVA